jgi:hypothetical protein
VEDVSRKRRKSGFETRLLIGWTARWPFSANEHQSGAALKKVKA